MSIVIERVPTMYLEQKTGPVPGLVFATFRRGMVTRTFPIEIRQTGTGHYIARMPNQRWSVECRTVDSALLMHAAVLFPTEHTDMPWLSNPKPVSKRNAITTLQSDLVKVP